MHQKFEGLSSKMFCPWHVALGISGEVVKSAASLIGAITAVATKVAAAGGGYALGLIFTSKHARGTRNVGGHLKKISHGKSGPRATVTAIGPIFAPPVVFAPTI